MAPPAASASETRARLLTAAADMIREHGAAAASARAIAGRADVNQALIFYHFGTVRELVEAACRQAVDEAAESYRNRFAQVRTLRELLQVGREMHAREVAKGNVAMMAQLMAGGRDDPVLAAAARYAIDRWVSEIEPVLQRLLADSPLTGFTDSAALARAVTASFIGLELYQGVDDDGAAQALDALDRLGMVLEVVDDLGPIARRALRAKLRGASRSP